MVAGGGGEGERLAGCRPAGPSVCRQKIEFICVIQMLMLSSLFVCVLLSQRRGLATGQGVGVCVVG